MQWSGLLVNMVCTRYFITSMTTVCHSGFPYSTKCIKHLTILLSVFNYLNIPIASEKLEGLGTTLLSSLGIKLTEEMILRLPKQKLEGLKALIESWM